MASRRRHVATRSLGVCRKDNITFCRARNVAAGDHSTLNALNHLIARLDWAIPFHNRNPNGSDRALVRLLGGWNEVPPFGQLLRAEPLVALAFCMLTGRPTDELA